MSLDRAEAKEPPSKKTKTEPSLSSSSFPLFSQPANPKDFVQAVTLGKLKEAESMLNKDPTLLLKRATVMDRVGRKHEEKTGYEIALGAQDYTVKSEIGFVIFDGMVEMIETHFEKLPGKTPDEIKTIMQSQFKNQFPDGWEKEEKKRIANDSKALHTMITVIQKTTGEDCSFIRLIEEMVHKASFQKNELYNIVQTMLEASSNEFFEEAFSLFTEHLKKHYGIHLDESSAFLLKSLYQFKHYFQPKANLHGPHFNYSLLEEATALYDKHYEELGNSPLSSKNLFHWQNIYGLILHSLPDCDTLLISKDISSILKKSINLHRSFAIPQQNPYHDKDPHWKVGHHCAGIKLRRSAGTASDESWNLFKKYVITPRYERQHAYASNIAHEKASSSKKWGR